MTAHVTGANRVGRSEPVQKPGQALRLGGAHIHAVVVAHEADTDVAPVQVRVPRMGALPYEGAALPDAACSIDDEMIPDVGPTSSPLVVRLVTPQSGRRAGLRRRRRVSIRGMVHGDAMNGSHGRGVAARENGTGPPQAPRKNPGCDPGRSRGRSDRAWLRSPLGRDDLARRFPLHQGAQLSVRLACFRTHAGKIGPRFAAPAQLPLEAAHSKGQLVSGSFGSGAGKSPPEVLKGQTAASRFLGHPAKRASSLELHGRLARSLGALFGPVEALHGRRLVFGLEKASTEQKLRLRGHPPRPAQGLENGLGAMVATGLHLPSGQAKRLPRRIPSCDLGACRKEDEEEEDGKGALSRERHEWDLRTTASLCKTRGTNGRSQRRDPPMKKPSNRRDPRVQERVMRFELTTTALARQCSTTELHPQVVVDIMTGRAGFKG